MYFLHHVAHLSFAGFFQELVLNCLAISALFLRFCYVLVFCPSEAGGIVCFSFGVAFGPRLLKAGGEQKGGAYSNSPCSQISGLISDFNYRDIL